MNPPENFEALTKIFTGIIKVALPVLGGIALLVFLWGLAKFIFRIGGDASDKEIADGKSLMVWGLIALFFLVSFWSIIAFFYNDFGFVGSFGLPLLPPFN